MKTRRIFAFSPNTRFKIDMLRCIKVPYSTCKLQSKRVLPSWTRTKRDRPIFCERDKCQRMPLHFPREPKLTVLIHGVKPGISADIMEMLINLQLLRIAARSASGAEPTFGLKISGRRRSLG